jgi:hypothetical protein
VLNWIRPGDIAFYLAFLKVKTDAIGDRPKTIQKKHFIVASVQLAVATRSAALD